MKVIKTLVIASAICILNSCSTPKSLTYFTDIETIDGTPYGNYLFKIEPADELVITVTSDNPVASSLYNLPFFNPAKDSEINNSVTPRQQTYIVDSEGNIDFPVLGKIHVAGLTTEQLRDLLVEKISKDVADPYVRVQLVNFVVDIAGELNKPGRINVSNPRFTVLDAISEAGDLTLYGQRNNVLVVREEDGVRTHARLDLTKAETFNSPYFYLKQHDFIYVEPDKVRTDNAEYNQNNSYKLSLASTIVSACSVVISLIIALTR